MEDGPSTGAHRAPYIDPARTALLVIDMQKGFCHPESLMEKAGIGSEPQRAIIPDVVRLIETARRFEIPVLWSKQVHFPEDVTRKRRVIPSHIDKQNWAPCLRGTWEVDLMPEMEAVRSEDDHIVEKHRASMFFETNLDAKLRMLGIEHVIVSGVVTYFCVETSIRDAYYRDMDVTVVRETVAGPNQRFHEDTLAKVDAFWGAVVGLDELSSLMTTSSAGASA